MTKTYDHLARAFFNEPWLITERKLAQLQALALAKLAGAPTPWEGERQEPFAATLYEADESGGAVSSGANKVAVIPLYGVLLQRVGMLQEMSGATSTERFKRAFVEQLNNPAVKTIVIDVDSPGGGVYGIDELATLVHDGAARKQVVAVADSLMASAAYYVASGAGEIVASPSSEVGSIGVLAVHYDFSAQAEMEGVKPTLIKAGKYKAEGHPDFPLEDAARQHIQEDVDRYYAMFVAAVAKGRGVSVQAVRSGFGEGRVVGAQEAVRLGMADRVATLEETVQRFLGGGRPARRGASAENTSSFLLTVNRNLSDAEVEKIRADLEARFSGLENAHEVVELDDGVPADAARRDRERLQEQLAGAGVIVPDASDDR